MVTAAQIADTGISVTELIGKIATLGAKALPAARIFFDFVPLPFAGAVVDALTIAAPYLAGVATAAPIVENAINDGRPVLAALQAQGPQLVADFKALFAIAVNHDPERPETALTPDQVSHAELEQFASNIFTSSLFTPQDPRFEHGNLQG